MEQVILIFHFLFAVAVIGLVLLQKGKGGSMGTAFGAGASQTFFGSKGSTSFLLKLTLAMAGLFFATSISLTYIAKRQAARSPGSDILGRVEKISQQLHKEKTENTKELKKTPLKKKSANKNSQ